MTEPLPPPLYTSQPTNEDAPPSYAFPETFRIGFKRTSAPLVDSAQLKGHLALLDAFVELRKLVDGFGEDVKSAIPQMPDDVERRWAWFVGLAVERCVLRRKGVLRALTSLQIFGVVFNHGIGRHSREGIRRCGSSG